MARAATPAPVTPSGYAAVVGDNGLPPAQPSEKTWWRDVAISSGNWNQLFPYQLLVCDQLGDGSYAVRTDAKGTWRFTLPIPPEAMSTDWGFAMTPNLTFGGVVEESSGLRIGTISLSGTTGTVLNREAAPDVPPVSFAEAVFAGTLSAASQTAAAAVATVGGGPSRPNVIAQSDFEDPAARGRMTGYYQLRLLQYFLESYVELKRLPDGRRARLAWCQWKDESVYLVTPANFRVTRNAAQPLEYAYSLQFTAWKRIRLSTGKALVMDSFVPVQRDPNRLAKLLSTIESARQTLQGARRTILAVGGDVQHSVFEPLRELGLFAKDALAVPLAVADLGDSLIQSTRDAILDLKSTRNAVSSFPKTLSTRTRQVSAHTEEIDVAVNDLAAEQADDPRSEPSRLAHPGNTPFEAPSDNFDFFSTIRVGDLRLPPVIAGAIAAERARCRALTRVDFATRRDSLADALVAFERAVGADGAGPGTSSAEPSSEDYGAIYALNQAVMETSRLVIATDNDPQPLLDAMSAVAGLATQSGIAFRVPRAKYAVPFPYGSTLEMLAQRYLGDANRASEISVLNGLRPPYVDEEGFDLPLLVNGSGNQVVVTRDTRLFAGQPVWIASAAVTRTRRRVTRSEPIGSDQLLLTLDGDADLDRYTTLAQAVLQAFLPDTVNSQQTIFIPSDLAPQSQSSRSAKIAGVDEFDPLLAVSGADWLLTPQNDLVLTNEADVRWAVGLVNAIQQVRLALSVPQGKLLGHPEFGLPLEPGQSVADLNAADLARAAQSLFAGNPTFSGVTSTQVRVNGPTTRLNLAAQLAGTTQIVPLSIEARS